MNPSESYLIAQVQSATPGGLIVMLYDGLLRFAQEAEEKLIGGTAGDLTDAAKAVHRATDILTELTTSLRPEYNPDLCLRLSNLYAFFTTELSRALHERNGSVITHIVPLIGQLRDAWQEAETMAGDESPAGATG